MLRIWKEIHVATIFALCVIVLATVAKADIMLPAGTDVEVVFEQDVSSRYAKLGDLVPIRLNGAVEYGGLVVVKDGARGSARVKSVRPAGRGGKPGRVEVVIEALEPGSGYQAVDDKKIVLEVEGGSIVSEGKGKKLLSYIFGFGLIIKGGQGEIPADKSFKAKTSEDVIIVVE